MEPLAPNREMAAPPARPVLVVDDEPNILRAFTYSLGREGYWVETAPDGPAGLDLTRRIEPLVIILDVMMPGLDGYEVCEQIRKDSSIPRPYIIMLSAKGQAVDIERGLAAGADEYMTKPFSPVSFALHLREVVARLQQEEPASC